METLGAPPPKLVEAATRRKVFFEADGAPKAGANSRGKRRRVGARDLMSAVKGADVPFLSFVEGTLRWDSAERFTPEDGLAHAWIADAPSGRAPPERGRGASSAAPSPRPADRSWLVAPGPRRQHGHGAQTHRGAAEPQLSMRAHAPNSAREAPLVGHLLPGRTGRRRHSFGVA